MLEFSFIILTIVLLIDIFIRAYQIKHKGKSVKAKTISTLDIKYPVKVLDNLGNLMWCHGIGKHSVHISPYQYIPNSYNLNKPTLEQFLKEYTIPSYIKEVVTNQIFESELDEELRVAKEDLKMINDLCVGR